MLKLQWLPVCKVLYTMVGIVAFVCLSILNVLTIMVVMHR